MPRGDLDLELAAVERTALVEEIIAGLEARGVPEGTWLVDIARVRTALHAADDLLARMQDSVLRAADPPDALL